jgi:outer membrane protein assembly factor BamB
MHRIAPRRPFTLLALLSIASSVFLVACGGGGGGGGGGAGESAPSVVDKSWLSFSPSQTELETYAGEPKALRIVAVSSRVVEGTFNVGIVDTKGVLDPIYTRVDSPAPLTYEAWMRTASGLATGTYSGTLELRLCRDNPTTCAQPVPGSPWQLPYRIVVQPVQDLRPLRSLAGAQAWTTYQGNASHTGFVNASVQPGQFSRRWVADMEAGALVADAGRVWVTPRQDRSGQLLAVSEHDGSVQWRWGAPATFFRPPGLGDGRVWTLHQAFPSDGGFKLSALDAASGTQVASVAMLPDHWVDERLAPVVANGSVFLATDDSNTIARHRATDATQEWRTLFGPPYPRVDRWSPSVAEGRVVTFDGARLWIADSENGSVLGSVVGPFPRDGFSDAYFPADGAPVLAPGRRAFVRTSALFGGKSSVTAFDLDQTRMLWTQGEAVHSNPVLAQGVVYAAAGAGELHALDAQTGALLWRWEPPKAVLAPFEPPPPPYAERLIGGTPLVVVGNLAFMAVTDPTVQTGTHVVDLTTRKGVWHYPAYGAMAVSPNGVLYIATGDKLHAINLH